MVLIEGIDGTGKTTVASELLSRGFIVHHLEYNEKNLNGCLSILEKYDNKNLVLDRCFITEVVYGPILRNASKISESDLNHLIEEYSKKKCIIIYLKSLKEDLLKRRCSDDSDYKIINNYYTLLDSKYDEIMDMLSNFFEIYTINTSDVDKDKVKVLVNEIVGDVIKYE